MCSHAHPLNPPPPLFPHFTPHFISRRRRPHGLPDALNEEVISPNVLDHADIVVQIDVFVPGVLHEARQGELEEAAEAEAGVGPREIDAGARGLFSCLFCVSGVGGWMGGWGRGEEGVGVGGWCLDGWLGEGGVWCCVLF